MKKRFILASLFLMNCTGVLHADSTPTMSRVYGDQFTPQVAATQAAAVVGTLDTVFASGGYKALTAQLTPGAATAMQVLSDGTMLVALDDGTNSYAVKYDAQGAVETYGSSGIATLGLTNVYASMIDTQGRLIVAGTAASGVPMQRVLADGTGTPSTFTDGTWNNIAAVAEQTTGNIIAVGFDGTNAQICRYLPGTAGAAGALDSTFNSSTGGIVFDGINGLTATTGLFNVVIDSSNNIYVAYVDSAVGPGNLRVAKFAVNGAFTSVTNFETLSPAFFGTTATASQVRMAMDKNNNLIVAAQVGSNILVSAMTTSGGAVGSFTNTTVTPINSTMNIGALLTASNGQILLVGTDEVSDGIQSQRITSLNSTGGLDTSFNPSGTQGYKLFSATSPTSINALYAAGLAPNGQIYAVGYESSGTANPYIYRLNNYQYVSQVAQFPLTSEQGNLDLTFGNLALQTYEGIVSPFNGLYGPSLMQQATSTIEVITTTGGNPTVGDILIGMNGLTNGTNYASMMFSWLTSAGELDMTVNASTYPTAGYMTLTHDAGISATYPNEYLTAMVQGNNGIVYVAGYASSSTFPANTPGAAILRTYSSFNNASTYTGNPSSSASEVGAGFQAVGISRQDARTLLCVAESATVGHISGYLGDTLDTSFGNYVSGTSGPRTGKIATGSYGVDMGPCYGLAIDPSAPQSYIYAAYVSTTAHTPFYVNVAKFQVNGSGLVPEFGTSGVKANIFSGATIAANNVRIGLDVNGDIIVAAVSNTTLYLASIDSITGDFNNAFSGNGVYSVVITGGSSLQLERVTGISNGTFVVTFSNNGSDDTMFVARVTAAGALDTTFNAQGAQQGVLPVQVGNEVADYASRTVKSTLIQSTAGDNQGDIVMVGSESVTANDSTPMAMRVYGTQGTTEIYDYSNTNYIPGKLEASYSLASISAGSGNVVFTYPSTSINSGKLLIGIDNGTTSIVARVTQSDMSLDGTFGTSGKYTVAGTLRGISHISLDADENVLIGGASSSGGWAQVLTADATAATSFDMPGSVIAVNNILQQTSGRYIVAGTDSDSNGVLVAFKDQLVTLNGITATTLAVDPTFNPLNVNGAGVTDYAGAYIVAASGGLYAMAINSNDTIVVAYSTSNNVNIAELTANGSGLASAFNSGAVITTGVAADNSAVVQLNIDDTGNIIVAASYNSGGTHQVQAQRFDSTGGTASAFTGAGVTSGVSTISFTGSTSVTLTGLMETNVEQTVLVGYNTAATTGTFANGPLFAARLTNNGILDPAWNTNPVGSDFAGLLTYGGVSAYNAIVINGGSIALDAQGSILSIGSTAADSTGIPIITEIYGDAAVYQVSQNPLESAVGTSDLTLIGSNSGAMPLATLPDGNEVLGVPQKMYIYNSTNEEYLAFTGAVNGAMLIASTSTSSATVYLTALNADLSLNTGFNSTGYWALTPNSGTTPVSVTVTDLYVANGTSDSDQYIYLTGYTRNFGGVSTSFFYQITSDGSASTVYQGDSVLTTAGGLPVAGCVRQSSNSRILVSGYAGGAIAKGVIAAYKSDMSGVDTSFGNAQGSAPSYGVGYYTTGTNANIPAMTTDNSDRLYIAYRVSATTINLDRVLENGTTLDTSFNSIGRVTITGTAVSSTQIKLAIDLVNSQIIVAVQDTVATFTQIKVNRYNFDGSAAGSQVTVAIASKNLQLADLFIDNDTTSSAYPNIYVVGYNSTDSTSIVARIATTSTTMALDTSYVASTGIANISKGLMTVVTAGALDPDRRVYMVGSNGASTGYMARNYGDYYWNQASPAILQGDVGTPDLTLNPGGASGNQSGVNIATVTGWALSGYTAYAVVENPAADGTSFIAFGNGTNLIVGKVNADMSPATDFSTDGLTATIAMSTVTSMAFDSLGNLIVAGTNAGASKTLMFSSVGALTATFATTLGSTVGTTVAQQKSGRYLVGGKIGSNGAVCAFQNASAVDTGSLPIDPTFGPAVNSGYYPTGVNSEVDDLVIDQNDYIYIVYRNSGVVYVAKLTPEGALSTAANTPSAQLWQTSSTNPIVTSITATQPARIAINSANNILVGAKTSSNVSTQLYNANTGATIGSLVAVTTAAGGVLTRLVGSGTEFYGSVYTSTPSALAFAITNAGALDSSFGTSGVTVAITAQSVTSVNGISIQADGKLVMVGGEASPAPVLLRVYGYPYVAQYEQAPNQAAAGTLDTTLWPTTGALALDTYTPISGTITTLDGYSVARMYEYSDGKALLLFTKAASNSILARVNKDLTLDTSFGTAGRVTMASSNANALFVNSDGAIYVGGGTAAQGWIYAYFANGTLNWSNTTITPANGIYEIIEQSPFRVIAAGKGGSNGTLYAYNTSGTLDITFGNAGIMTTAFTNPITDITIDADDNIICVTNNAGTVALQICPASGLITGTMPSQVAQTQITTANDNPRVILDSASLTANIIVASATTNGFTIARYSNTTGAKGNNNGSQINIAAGGSNSSVLGNIYATATDGKVAMIGYETATNTAVVARITSAFALDATTFNINGGNPGVFASTITSAAGFVQPKDGFICADDRIMLAGGSSTTQDPYLARVFGDTYQSYVSQAPVLATEGTLDTTFGSDAPPVGIYNYQAALSAYGKGEAILAVANGGYYMALTDGTNSTLIRTFASGALDTNYGLTANGIAAALNGFVVNSMMMDGSSRLVLTGTSAGVAKVARFVSGDSGALDTSFDADGVLTISGATLVTAVVEQTLGRYVIAGQNATGGVLYAYTSLNPSTGVAGVLDTTFNAGDGGTPGSVQITTGAGNGIYNLISDQYDRLIFAVLNTAGTSIDLYRLTPTGELDVTFGTGNSLVTPTGKRSVFTTSNSTSGFDANSIRVAFDSVGNIVVAGYVYTSGSLTGNINIAAYDNGVLTTVNSNGLVWTNAFAIPNVAALTGNANISLTGLATTSDNNVLVLGNSIGVSSTLSPTWIARLANTASAGAYALDTTFNPGALNGLGAPAGGIAGIFEYSNTTLGTATPFNVYNALTVLGNGEIAATGYELNGVNNNPTVIRVYNTPYTTETIQTPNSKAVGTNDATLGVGSITTGSPLAVANGITFFGIPSSSASNNQVARAIALQDDNNLVVAVDGTSSTSSGYRQIFINKFDNDGLFNQNFNTTGQATVSLPYTAANQYVQDMVTFTTVAGVNKAILAGYTTNSALASANQNSSLLFQYNLSTPGLDIAFGGFDENPDGVAFGDGKQINVVGRQSNGRIIAGGQSQDDKGLLLGYTADGKMDTSFGSDGYLVASATSNALFTHAIDTQNRVVIAYRDTAANKVFVARFLADGSGLDTSFSTDGLVDTGIVVSGNSDMRVALDSSNNVVVAMIASDGTTLTIRSYSNVDGSQTTTFAPSLSLSGFTLSRLLIDIDGKAIVVGSDNGGEFAGQVVIARTTTALTALDSTFNTAGTAGYLKYIVASGTTQQTTYAMIHPDGRILIVGSEN